MVLAQEVKREYQHVPIELPKLGSRILVEKLHVSKTNVNVDEPFGESEEDKKLVANLRAGKKIVQPFKARPEGDGYGVYIGRSRFLGMKEVGAKFFVVGDDCLINNISEEEAEEDSWTENFKEFHKEMNPITRAKRLDKIVGRWGLREYSRRSGIPPSSLSTHLSVLKLSSKMQDLLAKRVLIFTDGVMIARMKLDTKIQDRLAGVLMVDGTTAFRKECNLIIKQELRKKRTKKTRHSNLRAHKRFWRELTESLREFFNYWSEYSKLKEWQDDKAYYLVLEVTMRKDLNESHEPDGLETLGADEAPQICGSCGQDILEGDKFTEKEGLYYCRECATKE